MLNDEQKRMKAKLQKQVEQFERKGYMNTDAHEKLASLLELELQPAEGVSLRSTKKVKQEVANGEQNL
jgi:hypothetical protein